MYCSFLPSPIISFIVPASVPNVPYHIHFTRGEADTRSDIINYKFTSYDIICIIISLAMGGWYLLKKVRTYFLAILLKKSSNKNSLFDMFKITLQKFKGICCTLILNILFKKPAKWGLHTRTKGSVSNIKIASVVWKPRISLFITKLHSESDIQTFFVTVNSTDFDFFYVVDIQVSIVTIFSSSYNASHMPTE